jgi:hypothetical protein
MQEVKTWCSSAAQTHWGKIILSDFDQTYKTWNRGEQTGEGFMWWEGPVSLSEQGQFRIYSGIWNEGHPGTSYGGNMTVVIDTETDSIVDFIALNIAVWDCGPEIGQVIGREDQIAGPMAGKKIPHQSWGDYSVRGKQVCSDYVTDLSWKWGCPEFDDELISFSCNDETELILRIWEDEY